MIERVFGHTVGRFMDRSAVYSSQAGIEGSARRSACKLLYGPEAMDQEMVRSKLIFLHHFHDFE